MVSEDVLETVRAWAVNGVLKDSTKLEHEVKISEHF